MTPSNVHVSLSLYKHCFKLLTSQKAIEKQGVLGRIHKASFATAQA
jgi:hypothetical protein